MAFAATSAKGDLKEVLKSISEGTWWIGKVSL